jgi:replicative DNA helicase
VTADGKVRTAADHARVVLAAIIPDRGDLLDRALLHLSAAHFPDSTLCAMFQFLERYSELTGQIITRDAIGDLLARKGADAGKILLYQETWDYLADTRADDADFRWSLDQLRELAASRATGTALTEAMEILTHGAQSERGEPLRGHTDARNHVMQRFAEIDRDLSMQDAPEGDMGAEGEDILAEYAAGEAARLAGRGRGIMFGIPALDDKTNGLANGDLALLVGFVNEGKTHLAVQLAWHASVMQGKNVVFLTTETIRTTVRRRLLARHSCMEHFGLPRGINSDDLKRFTLTPELKHSYEQVVADSSRNPGYGKRYLAQVPRGATIGHIESKLIRLQRMFPLDLVVMDSLYLLRPEKRRNTDREELSSIIKSAKQLATTFNDGLGVPFVSPWQVSRRARLEAQQTMTYSADALSETAEAANSPDLIISLLAPLDNDQRYCTLKMQLMKARDGERANSIEVDVDYATSRFTPKGGNSQAPESDFWGSGTVLGFDLV